MNPQENEEYSMDSVSFFEHITGESFADYIKKQQQGGYKGPRTNKIKHKKIKWRNN